MFTKRAGGSRSAPGGRTHEASASHLGRSWSRAGNRRPRCVCGGWAAAAKPPKKSACVASIGVMGGFTGARAAIGQEELNFARLAVARFNGRNHTKISLVEGDIQVDPSKASLVAQQFASNRKILAIAGPDASFAVDAAGAVLTKARIAFVSGS